MRTDQPKVEARQEEARAPAEVPEVQGKEASSSKMRPRMKRSKTKKISCGSCDFETTDSNEMIKHFILKHPDKVQVSILENIKSSKERQDQLKVTINKDGEIIST